MRTIILALMGASGSGKTSLEKSLIETYPFINKTVQVTSRPIRESEIGKPNYVHLSKTDIISMSDKLMAQTTDSTNGEFHLYGTLKSSVILGFVNTIVVNPVGLLSLYREFSNNVFTLRLENSDSEIREGRQIMFEKQKIALAVHKFYGSRDEGGRHISKIASQVRETNSTSKGMLHNAIMTYNGMPTEQDYEDLDVYIKGLFNLVF
jgi:ABC-type dipeptide/oligopeptide/nickel transport system ATPase component